MDRRELGRRSAAAVFACLAACLPMCACSPEPEEVCTHAGSALSVCPRGAVTAGVDVSAYQGSIAWAQVKASGIAFAFARVSDGATTVDAEFANNWRAMKSAGLVRGAYQFFRASEDPLAQASLALSMLADAGGREPGDLPAVMDIETADGESSATVRARMATWIDAVARGTGAPPLLYTNAATSAVIGTAFAGEPLWVANWGATCPTMPDGWSAWTFWQHSDMGTVPGVTTAVDLDEFDGTLAELLSFAALAGDAGVPAGEAGSAMGASDDAGRLEAGAMAGDAGAAMGAGAVDAARTTESCTP